MKSPKISVIMLTYNREYLVGRAIESILAQTFADFEFVIVDNGAKDRSGEIADEYAQKDGRICVIHRERGSIGGGRNTGLEAAKGKYITFVDDDDWCEPDYLEFLYNLAEENGADISICGAADRVFDEKRIMTAEEALIELFWRKLYSAGFPMKLFKSGLFANLKFPENVKYDDIALIHILFARAKKVVCHGLPRYNISRHENNNSAWTTNHSLLDSQTLDEYLHAYRERTEMLSEMFPASAAAWRYFEWSFMISMVEKIERLGIQDCAAHCSAMVQELRENRTEFLQCEFILDFEKEWVKWMGL